MNELPLRHLFSYLDGRTTGPRGFSGPIGQNLKFSTTLPIVNFTPIFTELPHISSDLSADQKYLYDMCKAISGGSSSNSLANRSTGTINHARWLTLANSILRTYVGTQTPTRELIILSTYIVKVGLKVTMSFSFHY